jgi:hypothetical protein
MPAIKQYQGGLFAPPVFNATADPYNDSRNLASNAHGMTKGEKQMAGAIGIKSKFNRLYEGEEYKSMNKIDSLTRMAGKAKFLTPNGFKQSSGAKINSCAGDWTTTFARKPPVYIPECEPRGPRAKKETFRSRLIYTQPPKKPSGSTFSTPNIHFTKLVYEISPYDNADKAERARTAEGKRKTEGRPPFKGISLGSDPLSAPMPGEKEAVRILRCVVFTECLDLDLDFDFDLFSSFYMQFEKAAATAESRAASAAGASRRKKEVDGDAMKPFIPSHVLCSGAENSVFTHFPEHKTDPYDDKILRSAGSSNRLLPMAEQLKTLVIFFNYLLFVLY